MCAEVHVHSSTLLRLTSFPIPAFFYAVIEKRDNAIWTFRFRKVVVGEIRS
jgi:hypothetical protein